jgi:hypothetical protein
MNKQLITITAASFIAITALVFASCQRERDEDISEGTEQTLMERNAEDVIEIMEEARTGVVSQFKKQRGCATVTRDTLSNPKVDIVDFGNTNCLCLDGKNRRGSIVATYTGNIANAGSYRTITYVNFFVDDNELKGNKVLTNNGLNAAGNVTFTIANTDTLIKPNNAGRVSWLGTRTREYIAGINTPIKGDDMFKLTGTATGIKANGYSWSANITQPLIIDNSCKYKIKTGVVQLQPQGKALRTIDYGNGTCDNNATITINNKTFTFNFK